MPQSSPPAVMPTTLESLEHVLEQGFRDFVTLEASTYFAALRDDPRYRDLVKHYQD